MRCGVIGATFIAVCIYRNVFSLWQLCVYHPADGDILFQSLPHCELEDAIEGVTGSSLAHCGVVVYEHHCWFVVEAIDKVRKTFLPLWIIRGRGGHFEAYRPKISLTGRDERLHTALDHYMGRPYDFQFRPDDSQIYCSELVFDAYRDAFGIELGKPQRLRDLKWQPYEKLIRGLEGGELPLDRLMITPVKVSRSSASIRVYPKGI